MKLNNIYFILRHGEARSNKEQFVSSWPEKVNNPLTEKGKKQVKKIIPKLKRENIDLIFSSDLLRCKQTAEMISKSSKFKIKFDKRLRETNVGIFNGRTVEEWENFFKNKKERFIKRPPKGESKRDVYKRMLDFIKEINKRYTNRSILIISHGDVLLGAVKGFSGKKMLRNKDKSELNTGEYKKIYGYS